jgi:hypothetical protein
MNGTVKSQGAIKMWAEVGHEVGNGRFASNKNPTREIQFPYNEFVAGKVVWGGNGRL